MVFITPLPPGQRTMVLITPSPLGQGLASQLLHDSGEVEEVCGSRIQLIDEMLYEPVIQSPSTVVLRAGLMGWHWETNCWTNQLITTGEQLK